MKFKDIHEEVLTEGKSFWPKKTTIRPPARDIEGAGWLESMHTPDDDLKKALAGFVKSFKEWADATRQWSVDDMLEDAGVRPGKYEMEDIIDAGAYDLKKWMLTMLAKAEADIDKA